MRARVVRDRAPAASVTSCGTSACPDRRCPRLITSTPAAFLSSILRSSSANRYGGRRSSRSLVSRHFALLQRAPRTRPRARRGRRARPSRSGPRARSSRTATSSSPPSSSTVTGLSAPRSTAATAAPGRAGAGRHRLPHPALEDPRADLGVAGLAPERHVGAVGEQRAALDRRPERPRSSSSRSSPDSIAHCGLPIADELERELATIRDSRPAAVVRSRGEVRSVSAARPMSTVQVVGR